MIQRVDIKYKITEQIQNEYFRYIKSTLDYNDQIKNICKFLNYLKKNKFDKDLINSISEVDDWKFGNIGFCCRIIG